MRANERKNFRDQRSLSPSIDYYQATIPQAREALQNDPKFDIDSVTINIKKDQEMRNQKEKKQRESSIDSNECRFSYESTNNTNTNMIQDHESENEQICFEVESLYEISDETAMSWNLCIRGSSFVIGGAILLALYIIGGSHWSSLPGKLLFILAILGTVTILMTWYFHFRKISRENWKLLHNTSNNGEKVKSYTRFFKDKEKETEKLTRLPTAK